MVDGTQDTNRRSAAHPTAGRVHRNLCVVGDPDQSIYKWRAPSQKHPRLRAGLGDAKIIKLERNYR
jgi:DNA helicase-2/ATP-dependent DNA helicase PcrA